MMRCSRCGVKVVYDYMRIGNEILCIACAEKEAVNKGIKGNFSLLNVRRDPGEV